MSSIEESIEEEINRQIEVVLTTTRRAELAEQSTRAAALNAAAVTVTGGSQIEGTGLLERHVRQVLDLAERYAAWIRTGEDPERVPDLPPVDF